MDDQQHQDLENLRRTHQRQLQALEVQAAKFGLYAPPHVLIGIEDTRKAIAVIDAQLAGFEHAQHDLAEQQTSTSLTAEIEVLVIENQFAKALDKLSGLERYRREANLLKARLHRLHKDERQGVIDRSTANTELTKIAAAILELIST